MSSKAEINQLNIGWAGDMSASTTSPVVAVKDVTDVVLQINYTGTPTGTLAIQGTIDQVTWVDLGITPTAPAGAAGSSFVSLTGLQLPFIRIVYTRTGSTGVIDCFVHAKADA